MAAEFISDINPKQDVFEVKKIFQVPPQKIQLDTMMRFKGCYSKFGAWDQSREPMTLCSY